MFRFGPLIGSVGTTNNPGIWMLLEVSASARAQTVTGGLTGMCAAQALDVETRSVAITGTIYGSPNNQKTKMSNDSYLGHANLDWAL